MIETVQPLLSNHFNLTVELPLKAIVRGHSFAVIPISWRNRTSGQSKLAIQEMGSRYLFIVLYVFLEHHLSRGDYVPPGARRGLGASAVPQTSSGRPSAGTGSCHGTCERSVGIASTAAAPGPSLPSSTGAWLVA